MQSDALKVLIVVAHPDDADVSMGMKICNLKRLGYHVHIHCLSKGGKKANEIEYKQEREAEALRAGEILGVDKYTFSDFADTLFESDRSKIRDKLEKTIKEEKPDVVYTHYFEDLHIDHEITSKETLIAARSAKTLIYFRSPYSRNFTPKIFYFGDEISMSKKYNALKCFKSQKFLDAEFLKQASSVLFFEYLHPQLILDVKMSYGKKIDEPFYCEFFIPERISEVDTRLPKLNEFRKGALAIKEKVRFSLKN